MGCLIKQLLIYRNGTLKVEQRAQYNRNRFEEPVFEELASTSKLPDPAIRKRTFLFRGTINGYDIYEEK